MAVSWSCAIVGPHMAELSATRAVWTTLISIVSLKTIGFDNSAAF